MFYFPVHPCSFFSSPNRLVFMHYWETRSLGGRFVSRDPSTVATAQKFEHVACRYPVQCSENLRIRKETGTVMFLYFPWRISKSEKAAVTHLKTLLERKTMHFKSIEECFDALIKTSILWQKSHFKSFTTNRLPQPRQKNACKSLTCSSLENPAGQKVL